MSQKDGCRKHVLSIFVVEFITGLTTVYTYMVFSLCHFMSMCSAAKFKLADLFWVQNPVADTEPMKVSAPPECRSLPPKFCHSAAERWEPSKQCLNPKSD